MWEEREEYRRASDSFLYNRACINSDRGIPAAVEPVETI